MTREEAITVLKAFNENLLFSDKHIQAFNIAIHDIQAIFNLKDITQEFQTETREDVDNMFYNGLTLEDIRDNLQDFNRVIGEIKQILNEVDND